LCFRGWTGGNSRKANNKWSLEVEVKNSGWMWIDVEPHFDWLKIKQQVVRVKSSGHRSSDAKAGSQKGLHHPVFVGFSFNDISCARRDGAALFFCSPFPPCA